MLDISMECNRGGRERNEDFAGKFTCAGGGCFVVADGLGGHAGGEVAAEIVVRSMLGDYKADTQREISKERVEAMFQNAQNRVLERMETDDRCSNIRSTGVVLCCHHDQAVWGHIGDSRLYGFSKGKISYITSDHSVAYLAFRSGEIKFSEIRNSPDQNRLLRSFGTGEKFQPETADPCTMEAGDCFLLCSDGFWEYVTEKDMEKTLKQSSSAADWIGRMLKILRKNAKKDHDNYTVIAVRYSDIH